MNNSTTWTAICYHIPQSVYIQAISWPTAVLATNFVYLTLSGLYINTKCFRVLIPFGTQDCRHRHVISPLRALC
jgi:hypothetical protein